MNEKIISQNKPIETPTETSLIKRKGVILGVIVVVLILSSVFFWFQFTGRVIGEDRETIVVGAVMPMTGSAASYGERKIKSASLGVLLIKGEDAVKGLPTDVKVSKWLFKDIHVIRDSIAYW